mgnify:CR=1 FL=1
MPRPLTNIQIPKLDMSSLIPEIKIEGDWKVATEVIDNVESSIQKGYDKSVNQFSKELLSIIKNSVLNGTPPKGSGVHWAKHAPSTIRKHGKHKLLNLTGRYASLIGIQKYNKRTYIGVPLNMRLSDDDKKKITVGALARILEYGTNDGKIPGRPLWKPALKSVGGKQKLVELIRTNIRKEIMARTGVKANQIRW